MTENQNIFETLDVEGFLVSLNSGGSLSREDLARVVEVLEHAPTNTTGVGLGADDIYSLVLVIGRSHATEYAYLLERQLEGKDAFIASLILEILCLDWGFVEEYLERVVNFAVGVGWDEEDDVRLTAVKILGEYLHKRNVGSKSGDKDFIIHANDWPKRVLNLLLSIFHDDNAESWVRQGSYCSLCRAYGLEWEQLPGECEVLDLAAGSGDIRWDVIDALSKDN